MIMAMTRRQLLAGAVGATVAAGAGGLLMVDRGILPGGSVLDRKLGRCDIDVPTANTPGGTVVGGSFTSRLRRVPVDYVIGYPPGVQPGTRIGVCLVLHGFGATARDGLDAGRYQHHVDTSSGTPFALAAMDGGPGYWHPHATDDPLAAMFQEFLPLLAQRGLRTDRVAVLGWSMGGYGALLCGLTQPQRIVAVAASAPAFWRSYEEAERVNPGAFDSVDEWRRYDVLTRAGELSGVPLHIDCGEDDPFAPAVRALRGRLPDPSVVHFASGCHDPQFWQYAAPAQLAMIGAAL
jgi:S-formylglutathione hydrolase FrmB